ncbi:MAG: Gfo/Idh/MocA family oxidoreductase [Chloroflexi bacterium]|nr:Gfo/Idh/MocA family oxidoreductase [Chloroflexota bacterium]
MANPDSAPFRVASIGLGRWAKVIGDGATRSPRLQIVSCFTRDADKRAAFAGSYGCRQAESLEALLADSEVEGVMITTPNDTHADLIIRAAEAGKHVYTEKPISNSIEDAYRIVDACQKGGVRLAVGHSARQLGPVRKIRQMMEDGTLGDVSLVEANFSNDRGLELTPDRWRWFKDKSPGGPLIQLAVHHVDTLQGLFGPIQNVSAQLRRLYTSAEVDDLAVLICSFERGPVAYIGTSWSTAGVYSINVYGSGGAAFYQADFSHWSAGDTDSYSSLQFQARDSFERRPVTFEQVDMYRAELEDWADAARSGRDPEVSGPEATSALAVVWAAIQSSETGQTVTVQQRDSA